MMKLSKAIAPLALLVLSGCATTSGPAPAPRMLFDGKTLDGWTPIGGDVQFRIEDGAIVGDAMAKTPSTYLSTNETFSDFVFEAEMLVVGPMNSGIQFRTRKIDSKQGETVQGLQMEYDPSPRNWSGGIYGQSFGEWRYTTNLNPACREAITIGGWNTYRIEAIGPQIATFINGQPCSRYFGDEMREGFISLQMHSVNGDDGGGMQGKWRNIRIWTDNLDAVRTKLPDSVIEQNYFANVLSPWEQRVGFRQAWDGTTLSLFNGDARPSAEEGFSPAGPHSTVVSTQPYGNYELLFDFRTEPGATGHVHYLAGGDGNGGAVFRIADSEKTIKTPDTTTVGALYGLITPTNMLETPNRTVIRWQKAGDWNRARIVVNGRKVEHWLNHTKVVEYDRCDSKFAAAFKRAQGHIAMTDDTGGVSFRSVKIRDLGGATDPCLTGN